MKKNMADTMETDSAITKQQIQTILNRHLAGHKPIYCSTPIVDNWAFKKIFLYELWTLTETRKLEWTYFPIRGLTPSDKPDTDDLDMWEIDCGIPSAKGDASVASKEIKVPGMEYVSACGECSGGSTPCGVCNGKRNFLCEGCDGMGANEYSGKFCRKRVHFGVGRYSTCHTRTKTNLSAFQINRFCHVCRGLGRIDCPECNGSAIALCYKCRGKGLFKHCMKLKVHWTVHKSSWSNVMSEIDLQSLSSAKPEGEEIWQHIDEKAVPISFSLDAGVSEASQRLIERHAKVLESDASKKRIVAQRQSLRVIPMTRLDFRSSEFESPAFIVGVNDKIVLKSMDAEKKDKAARGLFSFLKI